MSSWGHLWWTRVGRNVYTAWRWKWIIKKRKWTIKNRKWTIKKNLTKDATIKESIKKPIQIKSPKEDEQLTKNNVIKDATIKESIKKPIEIKSLEEDENTTDWFGKNNFKKILDIVDSNKFNHKNKIGEFKHNEIKDLVNNIENKNIQNKKHRIKKI